MLHSDNFAKDKRSPKQLAQAILEHEFYDPVGHTPAIKFGQALLIDYRAAGGLPGNEGALWNALTHIVNNRDHSKEDWEDDRALSLLLLRTAP